MSAYLINNGLFESNHIEHILKILQKDPTLHFIDIGGFVGTHTLSVAASLNPPNSRKIVTVEGMEETCGRLYASLLFNNLHHNVTLLNNAISDQHKIETIYKQEDHVGASLVAKENDPKLSLRPFSQTNSILLNDLMEVITFKRAILKMDIEGSEYRAFRQADILFNNVDIPLIFMEWVHSRQPERASVIINFLRERKYRAFSLISMEKPDLDMDKPEKWPNEICWKKQPYLVP